MRDNFRKRARKYAETVALVFLAAAILSAIGAAAGCKKKKTEPLRPIDVGDMECLDKIRKTGNLYFEWIGGYDKSRPSAVIFHGETPNSAGYKFSTVLPLNEYTCSEKDGKAPVVADKIGHLGKGLKELEVKKEDGYAADGFDLSKYWTEISEWNLAIFHWEGFADEETPDDVLNKLYSVSKMRYRVDDGYETTEIPRNNLTETVSALYMDEFKDKLFDSSDGFREFREIRFIGNGVGADLALSVASYVKACGDAGTAPADYLPSRITLCDPYLPSEDMRLPEDALFREDLEPEKGMAGIAAKMISDVASANVAVEFIESREVEEGEDEGENTPHYAYDDDIARDEYERAVEKIRPDVVSLELSENYSVSFSDGYKKYKRIALDWYLYSIIGSDDSVSRGDGERAVGCPRDDGSNQNDSNWGKGNTRPMINNRRLNNDYSYNDPEKRKFNFSVSAWTPTIYTLALRERIFRLKKFSIEREENDIHGNPVYEYSDYVMPKFRSENYQVSDKVDYTLICGYVARDFNGNLYLDDGRDAGIAGGEIMVEIKDKDNDKQIASFPVKTDETGFYSIKLPDKETKDDENGYCLEKSLSVKLTFIPNSVLYTEITGELSKVRYYEKISGHNFSDGYVCDFVLNKYYADAITIKNCLTNVPGE